MDIKEPQAKTAQKQTPETKEIQTARKSRLAEALRKNLRRRKEADKAKNGD